MKGRRSNKTKEDRALDFKRACNRSGFNGLEIMEILRQWYGWKCIYITDASRQLSEVKPSSQPGEGKSGEAGE